MYEEAVERVQFTHFLQAFNEMQNELLNLLSRFVKENDKKVTEDMTASGKISRFLQKICV